MKPIILLLTFLVMCVSPILIPQTQAAERRTLCVFDPGGRNGDAFGIMIGLQNAAVAWGFALDLVPYTDEAIAATDFAAGKCDAALLTGLRTRGFVPFAGTIEAIGAVSSNDVLASMVSSLAKPGAEKLLTNDKYQVAGIFPAGQVYLHVGDRSVDTVGELSGRRIAVLDFDDAAKTLAKHVGASIVPADISTFATQFNNGGVFAVYAPATAFAPLELAKGIGKHGGVIRMPLATLTFQFVGQTDRFSAAFFQSAREYSASQFKSVLGIVKRAEASIPTAIWINIPETDQQGYDRMFREVRLQLRDKGTYDKRCLTMLRKLRCKAGSRRSECAPESTGE